MNKKAKFLRLCPECEKITFKHKCPRCSKRTVRVDMIKVIEDELE